MRPLTSLLLFFVFLFPVSAQRDTGCILHVRAAEGLSNIRSAHVEVTLHGIQKYSDYTDPDGKICLPGYLAGDSAYRVTVTRDGFVQTVLSGADLRLREVMEIKMAPWILRMDEIEIVAYREPQIYTWQRPAKGIKRNAKGQEIKDTIYYSKKELHDFELLKGDGWDLSDSVNTKNHAGNSDWQSYLRSHLRYPFEARQYLIRETLYFRIDYGAKGKMVRIRLLKGKNPILVLKTAQVLVNAPPGYMSRGEGEIVSMIVPIKFRIK